MRYHDIISEAFSPKNIEYMIDQMVKKWGETPQEINNGWCMGFAASLAKRLGPEAKLVSTTNHPDVFPGHTVVEYRKRFYDAEDSTGVDRLADLTYSKRLYALMNDETIEDSYDGLMHGKRVDENTLMEVSGTFGFYNPLNDTEVITPGGADRDHADYVASHPEQFGIKTEQLPIHDTNDHDARMDWMAEVLDLTLANGWVRVNQYRGAWSFQARDLKSIRATIKKYNHAYSGITEANCDVGMSSAYPDLGFTLHPYEAVQKFIKTGVVPR